MEITSPAVSLVTGGAGFIGSHLADSLLKMNHTVVVLDDLSGGYKRNVPKHANFVKGSILDEKLLDSLFEKYHFDYVFHLAAYAAEGLSHFIRKFNYENNLLGSINLINRSVNFNVKRFVFTSSIAVYGSNQTPMLESLTPKPEDPYGIAKYALELDLQAAHEMFGLNYTVFRPHNVYGERQNHGDAYRNVLGIFINNILQNKPLTIFGDGQQKRAFSYIDDVAPYIAECVNLKHTQNEVFNLGADKFYTVLDLAQKISQAMGVKTHIEYLPARKEVVDAYSDHSKAKNAFHITSATSLDEGITKMVEWSKKIGPLSPKKFGKIEVPKNMPPSWRKFTL